MLKHCLQLVQLVWLLVLRTVTPKSLWAPSIFSCWVERVGVACGAHGGCRGRGSTPSRLVPCWQLWWVLKRVPAFDLSYAVSSVVRESVLFCRGFSSCPTGCTSLHPFDMDVCLHQFYGSVSAFCHT